MEFKTTEKYLGIYVLVTAVVVTLAVIPKGSIDPISLPKLLLLVILGFIAAGLTITRLSYWMNGSKKQLPLLFVLFVTQLAIVFLLDSRDFATKFYGIHGRNTGFVAYLSLSFILIASATAASINLIKKYVIVLLSVGAIISIYGIFQLNGQDFYSYTNIYGSKVFGTFGNPNFQSAFMGIVGTVSVAMLLFSKWTFISKGALLTLIAFLTFNIFKSSDQGFLTLAVGIWATLVSQVIIKRFRLLGSVLIGFGTIAGLLIFLGIFNKGPFAEVIFKSSLQARGYYWRAAINMLIEKPLTGVGFDGFGDYYRRSRSEAAALWGAETTADSAHNVLLDIASSGGVFLALFYLGFMLLALKSIYKVILIQKISDPFFISIIGAWFAYQAQSFISINQLGLGIWGWSLTGLIIGYGFKMDISDSNSLKKTSNSKKIQGPLPPLAIVTTFITVIAGLVITIPPYLASKNFYDSLVTGDPSKIQNSVYQKPYDRFFYIYVARVMLSNSYNSEAIKILSDASILYPDSTEIWQIWSTIPTASQDQINRAKSELRRLDPFNPNLK